MLLYKGHNIVFERFTICGLHSFTQDIKSARRGAKVPASEGNDPLYPGHGFEGLKVILRTAYINFEVGREVCKRKVNMGIKARVNIVNVHS